MSNGALLRALDHLMCCDTGPYIGARRQYRSGNDVRLTLALLDWSNVDAKRDVVQNNKTRPSSTSRNLVTR